MNSLIMNMKKGTRMDLTAQIKDADEIFAAFRTYDIAFDKKFTSLNTNGPSTITFKGIHPNGTTAQLMDMMVDLHERAKQDMIGNVYLMVYGYSFPKNKERKPEEKPAPEEDPTL